ncbi:MAG: GNAT family N-acetyltransferase [Promethearchaeia archaeon]
MEVRIDKVSLNDLNKIVRLEKKIFKENAFPKNLFKRLINENILFLKMELLEKKPKFIGLIIIIRDMLDRVNIINFFIHPKHRNKGYGSYLFKFALNQIRKIKEIRKMILNVEIGNQAAIRIYRKFGFKIVDTIEKYYKNGNDAYLMELDL